MMLIEGMKDLKLIEKRLNRTAVEVQKYSSLLDNEKPLLDTEAAQRDKVKSLEQQGKDLYTLYLTTKRNVDYTNCMTPVEINGETLTISQWLQVRLKAGSWLKNVYESMNEQEAESHMMRRYGGGASGDIGIVRMYDEAGRMEKLNEVIERIENIDGRLEVVNATTELMEAPAV